MSKTGLNKVIQVWESRNKIMAPNDRKKLVDIIDKVATSFSAGPYFYFIFSITRLISQAIA